MPDLRPCDFRRPTLRLERFQCAHPLLHADEQIVTPRICQRCRVCGVAGEPRELPACHPGITQRDLLSPANAARSRQSGLQCVHIGEVIRTDACQGCRGTVRVKVYACQVHGETTLDGCRRCAEFSAAQQPG